MRNQTGYGYLVRDISCAIAKNIPAKIFTYSGMHPETKICDLCVLENRPWKIVFKFKVIDLWDSLKYLYQVKSFSRDSLRVVYSYLVRGYLRSELQSTDVIHIHGQTPNLLPFIKLCLDSKKKVVVTLHGLNSFSKYTKASQFIRNSEIELLSFFQEYKNLNLTVLTPMAKQLIVDKFGVNIQKKIKVIPNFLSNKFIQDHKKFIPVRVKKITIVYIGNISQQKNQEALLKTILKFYNYWKYNDYQFIFVGEITYKLNLKGLDKAVKEGVVVFTGIVSRNEVYKYYSMASLVVLLSKAEGFGLSIIEGFLYGVPALISSNIEIASIVGSKRFVYTVDEWNNLDEIFNKIHAVLDSRFDPKEIISYAKSFFEDIIIKQYLSILTNHDEDYNFE